MSSSFVKDCSNASGSSSGNKTFIIIVSNETGNLNLNENQLQSLLATHGADASSQVSVMQMGGGGNANSVTASVPPPEMTIQDSNISSMGGVEVPTLPLNFMLEGFPTTIPVEGVGGGYAELPLDADALQRLENVLHTEEAKQILGGPLLDIVKDPTSDHLEKLISSSSDSRTDTSLTTVKKKRPAPKRRSQRQMDKAEREEVEKILAENQLMLQKEREELQRIQMEQEQQRIQMEQEQQRIEGEPEKEEETDDDNEDDSEDSDDSESDSEVDDIEKDTTFKLENDLKKGKKPKPAPKEKLKAVAVKKNATISVGKGKTGGGKKGPDDTTGKGNVSVKKPPNTGGGKGKGTGGKKVPTGSVMKQKGRPKSSSNKKGKIISSAVVKPKKGTAITKKKVAGVAKKTPKSIGKKLLAKPKTTTVKKRKQNIKNEELVSKEEKEEEDKTDIKIDKVSKVVKMKKLSVKVKKLKDNLVWSQNKVETDESSAAISVTKEEENDFDMGIESVQGNGHIKNINAIDHCEENGDMDVKLSKFLHNEVQQTTTASAITTTTTTSCITSTVTTSSAAVSASPTIIASSSVIIEDSELQKGSTSPNNVAIVKEQNNKNSKISNSSLSNKVQSTVNSNDSYINTNNNSNCNVNNNYNNAVSQSVKLNFKKLDTDACDDNNLSDEKSDIDSYNKCSSQILMHTQNFSDEAIPPTSHRQADGSQARTPDKSAWNEQTDSYKKNSVHGMPNFNYSDDSSVKEISKKTRNKMQNDVEVLNPKEVLNFEVANTNYQIDVGDSSFKETNDPKMDCKTPCSSVDGVKNLASKKKASFENELNRGTFVSNKFLNAKFKKPNNKKVSSYSPTIPKSLKNFKIPLKNSANKRPPLISQLPAGKPYEHLKTSSIPSHNSFIPSPLDSFTSHSSPHDNKNTGSQIISNNNNNINVHKYNTHIADDSHTPVTSKKTPVTTNNNNMLKSDEKNDHLLSNLNFTPQKNNESNKIFKKSQNLKIVKKTLSNLDSSFKVESKIGNKDSSSNKAELETSISPNVFPLKNKNIEKMSEGQTIIRRSRRPIKKKTFGDDILFLDEKTRLHSDDFDEEPREEVISNDEDNISNESDAEEDDDNDFENEVEDDDPERLWCICEKPHNNRFMICCDRCEDWFHGSCVGVTKSMGKQMEQRKVQWICPNCKKAERAIKGFSSPKKEIFKSAKILPRSPEVQITNEISLKKKEKSNGKISKKQENDSKPKEKTEPRVLVYEKSSGIVLSGTSAPTLNILPDWLKENPSYTTLQPAMMNSIQTDPKTGIKRINLEAFGLKPAKPKIDRSFSFQEKIDSVPISSAKKEKMKSSIKLLKHSEVLEIEKGKKAEQQEKLLRKEEKKKKKKLSLSLSTESPSPKKEKRNSIDLSEFYGSVGLKKTPVDKLSSRSISLSEETAPSSPSSTKKSVVKDFVRDGPLSKKPGIKSPEAADKSASQKSDTMKHRESVRKFLYDALHKRKSEVPKEFKDLTDENLKLLCKEIEEQFFMTFNKDVGFKYKTRCRSLIFNIKDSKNGGLFRQILSRTIPPEKLANMTSEELASKELAEWREREEKKELEAIQKHELERIALGNQYIMKSHKGEIVIDKEDLGTKSKDTESVISLAPDASKAVNSSVDTQEDEDTINHRNHIYNPSCKICQASELQNISKEELLEAKEELNIKDEEDHKEDKERRKSTTSRRESESSSSHHHSKHKKKEKERERDRSRERRHSHKSKDKDRERDKDRHRDRGDKDKEKSRRHRHSSGDKDRSRRHRSRERQSREKDSTGKDDSTKDEKKSEDRKRRHSGSRNEDRKRHIEEIKDEIKEEKGKKIVSDTELLDISIKFKGSSSEDSKSPLQASDDPNDSHSLLPLDILLPPLPPLPIGISELATLDNKSQENQDRSPATPPYPIIPNDNDYDDEESMLSPATPPLPDDDDDDEDRLTPPPPSLPAQKPLEDVQIPIWKGVINMPDVAKFSTAAFEVSGKALFFTGDVPSTVEVVGRISPDTVWTYIAQVKKSGSKEILVVRFQPSCEEEKVSYIALYSYLSSKKRYGVIGNCEKAVKDFYIVPLASHQPIPQVLLPLDGPGFEESRPHMLIGVIIRTKHKRLYDPISGTWTSLPEPLPYRSSQGEKDSVDERSYTPPPTSTPKPSSAKRKSSFGDDEDNEEVLEVLNLTPTPDNADVTLDIPPTKEKSADSAKSERESMLAELNRQIERDRKELSEMQKRADKKMEENEKKLEEKEDNTITIIDDNDQDSEVTSSDVGGPEGSQEPFGNAPLDTSKINIPSNLHEILASIKEKEKAIAEKENEIKRRLNMPEETSDSLSSSSKDVDLRLLLGTGKDQDLRVFTSTGVPPGQSGDQDFRSREPRDPRIPRDNGVGALPSEKGGQTSLSSLSDADLVAKAVEMEVGPTFNPADPGIHHMYEQRVPPEHPTSHGMMPPPGGPPPPHNMAYPPEPNPAPPNIPYPPHPMPPPGYRPQGPYMSGGPPPNGPPMGMPHGPPPPFIHDHPQHPSGPPIPSGHPGPPPPPDPACPPLYGPHRGSPSERMPVHGPYEEYPPYPQPRHVDDRRHHRMESGRHSQGGSWDSRRDHRDRDSNNFWSGEEGWDRRGDGNVRRGNMNKNYDRFPTDKKRRWKEGGGGGRPPHYRGRWGEDDNEDWSSGGDNRNWRNGGGKRPRRDRNWYDSTDRESGQKEIDY